MTIRIGITGSIAMGKSTIANVLRFFGIPVYDADKAVKDLLTQPKTIKTLTKVWPKIEKKEKIDKNILRKIIFDNKKEKEKLEKIIHPLVREKKEAFEFKHSNNRILGFDIPLLYETKQQDKFDYVFLVKCSFSTQRKRALMRNNLDLKTFNQINSNQMSVENKIKYNPIIINTEHPKFVVFVSVFINLLKIMWIKKVNNE